MSFSFRLVFAMLLPSALLIAAPSGTHYQLTLTDALIPPVTRSDGTAAESSPRSLFCEIIQTGDTWQPVIGLSPDYNRGHHRGRVLNSETSPDAWTFTLEMKIAGDPWIPGGRGEYRVTLRRDQSGALEGNYEGKFGEIAVHGSAKAGIVPAPPPPPEGFQPIAPGEHPRLLFRKSDIPLLLAKREHPVTGAAWSQIASADDNAIALGLRYQLTGDKALARQAVAAVERMMADQTGGSFNLGHEWGPRVARVAMAYDLCFDAWEPAFREKVESYITWISERLILRPNSVSKKVNWSPVNNYHAFLRGGAAIASLALLGGKGIEPSAPRDPGVEPRPVAPLPSASGAPTASPLEPGVMPGDWLVTGAMPNAEADGKDLLSKLGGIAKVQPKPGDILDVADHSFSSAAPDHFFKDKDGVPQKTQLDMTAVAGRRFHSTIYLHAAWEVSEPGIYQYQSGLNGGATCEYWLNGKRIHDEDYISLSPGRYALTIRARLEATEPWGRMLIKPVWQLSDRQKALEDLARKQEWYGLELAEWKEDHAYWQQNEGASARWNRNAELGRFHMSQYYRYCMGDGGYQVEGEGYTLHSCLMPLEYAAIHLRMFGQPVNPAPDISHFLPRYMMTTVWGAKPFSHSFSLTNDGTPGARHFAALFPAIAPEFQPAALWYWNQLLQWQPGSGTRPAFESVDEAVNTFLHYPTDLKPKPPGEVLPLTWAATTKGCYIFRNAFKGPDDIVSQVFLKAEGQGGWSHPDAGSIRIHGLGREWARQGIGNSKAGDRRFENVVMLPEDPTNQNAGASLLKSDLRSDGSGFVTMDLGVVYAGRKQRINPATGKIEPLSLYNNTFELQKENMEDLGIKGTRSFAVSYDKASGADALWVVADRITGGKSKVWLWQLPDPKDCKVSIQGNQFIIKQGDATLAGTVVDPPDAEIQIGTSAKSLEDGDDRKSPQALNAIRVTSRNNPAHGTYLVVLTLQRSTPPKVNNQTDPITVGALHIIREGAHVRIVKPE